MRGRRYRLVWTCLIAVGLLTAGCTASSGVSGGSGSSSSAAGTPHRGGTLTLLGQSDIFNLDTVSGYYTVTTILERMFARQLFTYPDPTGTASPPPVVPDIATVIPTTANGGITDGGKTLTIHIRPGVKWNSTPARQVTAADFVREFKMLCNPASPVGAPGYFTATIVGMAAYCNGFAKVTATAPDIDAYVNSRSPPGVVATSDLTLTFHLLTPTPDFLYILTMGFCSARPVEYQKYVPDSATMRQHTLSDGPYAITSYVPGKSFTLERNPAWEASTDPSRHAYVNITITEGLSAESVQQQLEAGTADMEWDVTPPTQDLPGLEAQHSPGLVVGPTPSGASALVLGVYLPLNEYAGPMKNKLVREAVAYGVDKNAIVQILGGKTLAAAASQLVLPGNVGYIPNFNPFPDNNGSGNPAMAKKLLAQAHQSGVTIKLLYSTTDPMPRVAQALQASLDAAGFKVKLVPAVQSDFYGRYLYNLTSSRKDIWDLAPAGFEPDWFGNNGRSTVVTLLTNPGFVGSNDSGNYNSAVVNNAVKSALSASSTAAAVKYWQLADSTAMKDVAMVPVIDQKWPIFHSAAVKGCNLYWWASTATPPTSG